MVAFKSGSILVLKTRFSKIQSIPMETCFFEQHFPFGFWLWTTYMIICYITKNSIPAQSLSLQHRSSGKLCVDGVEAERVMRGCEGMLAFQKGRSRTQRACVNGRRPGGSKRFIVHVLPERFNAHRNTQHGLFPEEPFRECEAKFSHWVTSIIATFYSVFWDRMDI